METLLVIATLIGGIIAIIQGVRWLISWRNNRNQNDSADGASSRTPRKGPVASDNTPRRQPSRPFQVEELKLAVTKTATPIRLFIAGPYIDPKKEPTGGENLEAKKVRYTIYRRIKDHFKYDGVLGEHEKLISMYKEHFFDVSSAALAEVAHIWEESDGVIIFPSSPGSFSELGYFAAVKAVSEKMLVILDSRKCDETSYVLIGAARMASNFGATICQIDYTDIESINEAVDRFINGRLVRKLSEKYTI